MTKTLRSEGQVALIEALKLARKDKGLTQAELATMLRCHQSFIARIESGERRIDVPELVILTEALGVDAHVILQAVIDAVPPNSRL